MPTPPNSRQYNMALTPYSPCVRPILTHPSWDSDSKRGTTDGTMRNKYDQHVRRICRSSNACTARGTARRADGADRPRLALGQGRHGTDRRLLEDGARG